MCLCVCVYIYIYIHMYICVYICVCVCLYIHTYKHTRIHTPHTSSKWREGREEIFSRYPLKLLKVFPRLLCWNFQHHAHMQEPLSKECRRRLCVCVHLQVLLFSSRIKRCSWWEIWQNFRVEPVLRSMCGLASLWAQLGFPPRRAALGSAFFSVELPYTKLSI